MHFARDAGSQAARAPRPTICSRRDHPTRDHPPRSAGSRRPRPMPAAAVRRDGNPHAACTDGACTLRGTPGHRPHELHARLSVRAVTTQPATTGTGHNRIRQPAPPPPTKSRGTRHDEVFPNRIEASNNRVGRPRPEHAATRPETGGTPPPRAPSHELQTNAAATPPRIRWLKGQRGSRFAERQAANGRSRPRDR